MSRQNESSFKKTFNILLPFLIYFVVHDLAQVLLVILLNVSMELFGANYTEYLVGHSQTVSGVLNALALLIGMASVWPMARKELMWVKEEREKKKNASALTLTDEQENKLKMQKIAEYFLLAVFAVTFALGMNILFTLIGITGSSKTFDDVAARQYGVTFGIGIIIYGILSPLAEEIVFRGLIYNRMKRYFPVVLTIVVSGILFGAYHGNLVQGIYGSIMGIAISYIYETYESFSAPFLFHALANISVFVAGYGEHRFSMISTTFNCVILLTVSLISLFLIIKSKAK